MVRLGNRAMIHNWLYTTLPHSGCINQVDNLESDVVAKAVDQDVEAGDRDDPCAAVHPEDHRRSPRDFFQPIATCFP